MASPSPSPVPGSRVSVLQQAAADPTLAHATQRLQFSPSYVVVGVYRLFTDKALYVPAWERCKHGTQRGLAVGLGWGVLTFEIQKKFIEMFLSKSSRITGLSHDTVLGYRIPFNVHTYAALLFVGSQATLILRYFLSRDIRLARERAWDYTVSSRGKGPEFWQPYVEEWDSPPQVDESRMERFRWMLSGWAGYMIVRILILSFHLVPLVGVVAAAWFKARSTARDLHKKYFESKRMTSHQIAVFTEERKWDYLGFGFVAALLEGLPVIGLLFSISNRVGAAMWAHDLEKRQHSIGALRKPQSGGEKVEGSPPPQGEKH